MLFICAILIITLIMAKAAIKRETEKLGNIMKSNTELAGNKWEALYGKHGYTTGQIYANVQPSGNMNRDFIKFVHGQGGGKSNDPNDPAAKFMPPKPDKDGKYYHTVNDITWAFFKDNAVLVGIEATPERFYNMNDDEYTLIVNKYISDKRRVFKVNSDAVAMVLVYTEWGSGRGDGVYGNKRYDYGALDLMDFYYQSYGFTINESIDIIGEYMTFFLLLTKRREQMKLETSGWNRYYLNWSSGLAHFHRVFKTYCES